MQPNPKKVKRNEDKNYAEIYQDNFLAKNDPAPLGQAAYNRQLSAGVKKRLGQDNLASSGQTSVGTTSATQRAGYSSFDNAGAAMERRAGAMARAQQAEAGLGVQNSMPSLSSMGQNFVGSTSATQRAGYTQADPITRQRAAERRAAQGEVGLTDPNMQGPTLGTSQFDAEMGEGFRNPVQRGPGRFGVDSELAQGVGTYSGNINPSQSGYSQFDRIERRPDGSIVALNPGYDRRQYEDDIDREILNPQFGVYNQGLADRVQTREDLINARDKALQRQYLTQTQQAGAAASQRGPGRFGIDAELGSLAGTYSGNINNAQSGYSQFGNLERRPDGSIDALTPGYNKSQYEPTKGVYEGRYYTGPSERQKEINEKLREMYGINQQQQYDALRGTTPQTQASYDADLERGYLDPTIESVTGGGITPETQASYDADLERGFLDSESYPTLDEVTNNSATDDGTTNNNTTNEPTTVPRTSSPVSSDISSKESNLYATLDAERDQVLTQFNNNYNQFMQLAINRGAVRGDLESQGFTGGIGQQIRDYLSTGEMQQLNELMMGRDQALKDIELRRNDVPTLALKQSAEELQLAMGSMQLKTQFAMDLATAVTSGLYGLDDAQVFADQYGLQNIQDLIISAAKAEIKAGADAATIKQSLIDAGIDPGLLDEIEEPDSFTTVSNDFLGFADKALGLADADEINNYDEWMDTYIAESGFGRDAIDSVIAYLGISLAPVTGGASLNIYPLGRGEDGELFNIGTEDRAVLTTDLVQSDFFKDFGEQLQSEGGMQGNISYARDRATQGAGLGYYNDTYRITVGGTTYEMEGADVTTLVASLTAGNFKVPKALLDIAEEVYNQGLEDGWAKFTDSFGGKYGNAQKLYKSVMKK